MPLLLRGRPVDSLPLLKAKQRPTLTKSTSKANGHFLWKEKFAPSSSQKDRAVALHGLIEDEVALVLDYQPDDPLPDRSFIELGIGSSTAVQLRNRLSMLSGLKGLPRTLAFDTGSLLALVEDLLVRLGETAGQKSTGNTSPIEISIHEGDGASTRDKSKVCHEPKPSAPTQARAQGDRLTGLASLFKCVYQAGLYNAPA